MAPWLPPIVMYCPPAQQCSAVAPPAPPRPHPRPRPVPPPCRCPPFSPPPPHPPRASPAIVICGGEGGALTGGALWVPCSWAGGGALPSLALWARPRAPYLGASPGLSLQGRARRWRGAPGSRAGKTRPARTSGTECHPALCAPNCLSCGRPARRQSSGTPGNGSPACASSTGGRAGAPRAAHSFAAFPLCIALPQLLHSPMVAPWLRRGASLCSGGAAQAPQVVKPGKNPVYPSDCHGNRA